MNKNIHFYIETKLKTDQNSLSEIRFNRIRDENFDFKDIPAGSGVYGIHVYPAMFHFMVVRNILEKYSVKDSLVWDPFMGSGVVAVECLINGRNFIGFDINPLAILISRVRITNIPQNILLDYLIKIEKEYKKAKPENVQFPNIDYWFDKESIQDLSRLKKAILKIENENVCNFYKVVFSEVVRKVSKAAYNEFKLLRKKNEASPNVISTFWDVSKKNIGLLSSFYIKNKPQKVSINLKKINILDDIPINNESIDLVLTSPPYGDSKTTVAYGQFSRLSLRWLDLEENVDRTSLGSRRKEIKYILPSEILYKTLDIIKNRDEKRAQEIFSFYYDLYFAIKNISNKVKPGGYVCFVVGNRRVKNQELPTDKISADFFIENGFVHEKTIVRAISNKRMPLENAPTNIKGEKDSTMRYEYLVILRKAKI